MKKLTLLLCLLLTIVASANYVTPPIEEEFRLLAAPGEWQIDGLQLRLQATQATYPMTYFWLCHFGDSNAICTGKTEEAGRVYLSQVESQEDKSWLAVTLIRTGPLGQQKAATQLVAGHVRVFDFAKEFERATKVGNPDLKLSSQAAKKLSPEQYRSQVLALSKSEWARLGKRK